MIPLILVGLGAVFIESKVGFFCIVLAVIYVLAR